jgi:3-phenylpropionate/cinnamic acid dioxygenase small subunit
MTNTLEELLAKEKIRAVTALYAEACDHRNWALFEQVFDPELKGSYGGQFQIKNRDKLVNLIKSMLGGCGASQHLLGNYKIVIDGNNASSVCVVRAAHSGKGDKKELFYEVWGEYRDRLECKSGEWRIVHRELVIHNEIGTQSVLSPA